MFKRFIIFLLAIGYFPVIVAISEVEEQSNKKFSLQKTETILKYQWIKSIPNYSQYFNAEHQRIINAIGIDNYLKLYESFGMAGTYIGTNPRRWEKRITEVVGKTNFHKIQRAIKGTGIYFNSISPLKKIWVIRNKDVKYSEAARLMNVSIKTIYRWRA